MKFAPLLTAFLSANFDGNHVSTTTSLSAHYLPPMERIVSVGSTHEHTNRVNQLSSGVLSFLQETIGVPAAKAADTTTAAPPTADEVKLLRQAFSVFYGVDRNLDESEKLLSQVIEAWQRQPDDEKAGLYRVRGDCYMALSRAPDAEKDYGEAVRLLQTTEGSDADPSELPAALLGQARAIRSQGVKVSPSQAKTAASDYQLSLRLSARDDWDTDAELEEDGAMRNPYAAWEWGTALRLSGDYEGAARVHTLASDFFDDIGDKARSTISLLDAGIDLAATSRVDDAKVVLNKAIKRTTLVEGRDVKLLQRVIAKEGEARIALASVLWDNGERVEAEGQLGTACARLDQLAADAEARYKKVGNLSPPSSGLKFSIDDAEGLGPLDISCTRFKNKDYVNDKLEWPAPLQLKVQKLNKLAN